MNKTNIRRVAMALLTGSLAETKGVGYNQRPTFNEGGDYADRTGHDCGTTACIAGHAAFFAGGKRSARAANMWATARKFLGVSDNIAQKLFAAFPHRDVREPTAKQAAMVLFNLAETGEVNWELAR